MEPLWEFPSAACWVSWQKPNARAWSPLIRPLMDDLISHAGFFIAQPLYAQILRDVDE